jgi:SAM-dependent methyltransferase
MPSDRALFAIALVLGSAFVAACGSSRVATASPTGVPSSDASSAPRPHEHGPLVHRFEHAEQWAKQFDDPARDGWQKPAEVVALLQIAPGATVADLGAGTGYFEPHLSRAVGERGHVLALDIEPDMVRYLRERGAREGWTNVEARVVPGDDPALPAGETDRILVVDTWHHVPAREAYAKKLFDALAPGGYVLVVDFTREASHGPPPAHRLAPEQVVRELEAGGLHAAIVPEDLPEQYAVAGRR